MGQAALSPLGGEFALLGDQKGHQNNPHVALAGPGGFVVWQTATESDSAERIMVQRLGADMTGVGVSARLSQSAERWNELNPRVALLADGGAVVVWVEGPRSSTDIYFRLLDGNGNFLGAPSLANSYLKGNQNAPVVATLSTGELVILWTSLGQDDEGTGVYGQVITKNGARVGGEFRVNQVQQGNQSAPSLVALDNGRFVVAWVNEVVAGRTLAGAQNLRGNLMGRIFDSQGRPLGNEYQLNDGQGVGFSPALGTGPDGGFALAWEERDEENMRNLSDIYTRTFNDSGLPLGDNKRQNTWLRGQQLAPEIIQLGSETLVAWTSYGQDDSGGGIQGRLLSGGREFQVNSQGRMHQRSPSLATDGGNKFLAVWVNTLSATHSVLSGQRYVSNEGDLAGVVDVTAGEAEVVEAPEIRRRAKPLAQAAQPDPVLTVATEISLPPSTPEATAAAQMGQENAKSVALANPVQGTSPSVSMPTPPPAQVSAPTIDSSQQLTLGSRRLTRSSLATRSATAGRNALLSAARQRASSPRTLMSRSRTSLASSRANRSNTSLPRYSFAQRLANQQLTAPRSSVASRQFQLSNNRLTTGRRTLASASSRYNSIMRNNLSRTGSASQSQSKPKPVATSLRRANDGVSIQWTSRQGARYQVQGSSDLTSWANVGAARGGQGGRDSVQVNTAEGGPRYYRVIQVD